jgi:hypothetical protein
MWERELSRVKKIQCDLEFRILSAYISKIPGDGGSIRDIGERIFPVAFVFRPALGPTQPPVQWVSRILSLG